MTSTHRHSDRRSRILLLGVFILLATLPGVAAGADANSYRHEIEAWRQNRVERLTAEDGWLTLIGLFWLKEGANTLGSAPDSGVVLPADKAPAHVGELTLAGDQLELGVAPGVVVTHQGEPISKLTLAADTSGQPTILDLGDLQFFVIERHGRFGLRVRDRAHPARSTFEGIDTYPTTPDWRITGRLERHEPPRTIPVPNVLGTVNHQASPGTVVFEVDDQIYRLDALEASKGRLHLIFADQTSGPETYGGGRFLYSDPVAEDGSVVLDFNKAYNPPCAFTDFATCPLPPRQNKLRGLRIDAGEKNHGRHH